MSIRKKIQISLDSSLSNIGIFSYWNRKVESENENKNEYIVYTIEGDNGEDFADDEVLTRIASITVRYYYRDTMLKTELGRSTIELHEENIKSALENAGFSIINGPFDSGDIDNKGFGAIIFDCEYWRVT